MSEPPERLPRIGPGTVLELAEGDWRYGAYPLRMRVRQVRDDLSRYYDGKWVWVVGDQLDPSGVSLGYFEALVRTDALRRAVASPPPARG